MGLYNGIFGTNKNLNDLIRVTRIDFEKIPRFRDIFLKKGKVHIYTRVGGGNRTFYNEEIAYMRSLPNYIEDFDDKLDNTYATFVYSLDKELEDQLKHIDQPSGDERWKMYFDNLEGKKGQNR